MSNGLYMTNAVQENFLDFEGGKLSKSKLSDGSKGKKGSELPEGHYKIEGDKSTHVKYEQGGPMCLNPDLKHYAVFGHENQEDFKKDIYNVQSNFVRKVYGIFSVQVLIMCVWVFYCQFNKTDGDFLVNVAQNNMILIGAIVLTMATLAAIILGMKNIQRKVPVNYIIGFIFTGSLSYIAGYATVSKDINVVLTAFITTFAISIGMAAFSPKILGSFGKRAQHSIQQAMGPIFGILGIIVVIICLISLVNPWGSAESKGLSGGNTAIMIACFLLVFVYMLLDTYAIVTGKYAKMINTEDYIFASSKLFADFILMFTLLANLFSD